ncbi:MAG: bifunctional diaminohydroxyphosphoribosylaminopyrimidine deaminase/5-amino-6-(5-phosphoribosylamino)uracil reductase RibD [Gammaproteobacteria bacterium]|nr:bifunctional diaminohydroxyphosphoribosylaminopyrimidine deaminase/5-amino-6-(5-phosphoribosylamino)uracil reductase RibD [Gammaproteobacteria bacterium]
MPNDFILDAQFMARALQLARKGWYTTKPNPRVGCVLVKDGRIIGEGWHQRAGQSHAEVEALNNTTENPAGATAYVTLEPCSHHDKTPPCCEAIIKTGIKRVVAAMQDPNPLVSGNGFKLLMEAGIQVTTGVLEQDARELNRGFIKRMTEGKPFVRSKLAMSLDGRTAMASGESQWITSKESRADVQKLRAESGAILTGINTVLADDPSLTARVEQDVTQPIRVVLDSKLQMPTTAKMLSLPGRTVIIICEKANSVRSELVEERTNKLQELKNAGAEIHFLPEHNGQIDLSSLMQFLAEQQINDILVEAGAILNGALLQVNLVDEWTVYVAPKVLGDNGKGLFNLPGLDHLINCKQLKIKDIRQLGQDLKLNLSPITC